MIAVEEGDRVFDVGGWHDLKNRTRNPRMRVIKKSVDDNGDDNGLRGNELPSSAVLVGRSFMPSKHGDDTVRLKVYQTAQGAIPAP